MPCWTDKNRVFTRAFSACIFNKSDVHQKTWQARFVPHRVFEPLEQRRQFLVKHGGIAGEHRGRTPIVQWARCRCSAQVGRLEVQAVTATVTEQAQVPIRGEFHSVRRDAAGEAVVIALHHELQHRRCAQTLEQFYRHDEFLGGGLVMLDGAAASGFDSGHANQVEFGEPLRPVRHGVEFDTRPRRRHFDGRFRTNELRQVTRDVVFDEERRDFGITDLKPVCIGLIRAGQVLGCHSTSLPISVRA
jgi:hypothetical protein